MHSHAARRIFWAESGDPVIDATIPGLVLESNRKKLAAAKEGDNGVVNAGEVRFLEQSSRLAALAAGEIIPEEKAPPVCDDNRAKVLDFKKSK